MRHIAKQTVLLQTRFRQASPPCLGSTLRFHDIAYGDGGVGMAGQTTDKQAVTSTCALATEVAGPQTPV